METGSKNGLVPGRPEGRQEDRQEGRQAGRLEGRQDSRLAEPPSFAVETRDLAKAFGRHKALVSLSCHVPNGAITGVVGPDAAGKTTFLRLLAGLLKPDAGSIRIFGRTPGELLSDDPNAIGYMPQKFGLYEDLTVLANLRLHARLRGLDEEAGEPVFERLLDFTGLGPFTGRLAGRLSGGMKQKLGIACALLGQPRLLLLDEPGVGVDPLSRRELRKMVDELAHEGMTIVWSTAYIEEAERCPHVVMLEEGRLIDEGNPGDFLRSVEGRVFLLPVASGNLARRDGTTACGTPDPNAPCPNAPCPNAPCPNAHPAGRDLFEAFLREEGVADVVVQGSSLRLVLEKDAPDALKARLAKACARAARPRLEDAYMATLGGMNKTPSPYLLTAPGTGLEGPAVEAEGLTKRYGSFTAAKDITFRVNRGEICGLLGPNGAGKSTTFRMLCGLSKPTSGTCRVAGINLLSSSSKARANLGYMAQRFSLYPDIPVLSNIRICADIYGIEKRRANERAHVLAEALGLEGHLADITDTLSLGLKQRLALLCATLHDPAVLFLDEPTSGVDVGTRRDFWKHILAMTAKGTSVLVTTHLMDEAEYCDNIALIYQGEMIRMGSPDLLKAQCQASHPDLSDPTLEEAFIAALEERDQSERGKTERCGTECGKMPRDGGFGPSSPKTPGDSPS